MTVRGRVNPTAAIAVSAAGLLFCSVTLTILLAVAVWPGEAKLAAHVLCPADQPDAYVVADSYSSQPGETTTNYTLYCLGERGRFTDVGFLKPFLVLWGLHTVILLVLFVLPALMKVRAAAAKTRALAQSGVLALARPDRGYQRNGHDDQRCAGGQDRSAHRGPRHHAIRQPTKVRATMMRQPNITARKLVVLTDAATNKFEVDWQRSAWVNGLVPFKYTASEENRTYDVSGQAGPVMEILQILKSNNIPLTDGGLDLRSNPAVAQQVKEVFRRAAAQPASQRCTDRPARYLRRLHRRAPSGCQELGDITRHRRDLRRRVHREAPADHLPNMNESDDQDAWMTGPESPENTSSTGLDNISRRPELSVLKQRQSPHAHRTPTSTTRRAETAAGARHGPGLGEVRRRGAGARGVGRGPAQRRATAASPILSCDNNGFTWVHRRESIREGRRLTLLPVIQKRRRLCRKSHPPGARNPKSESTESADLTHHHACSWITGGNAVGLRATVTWWAAQSFPGPRRWANPTLSTQLSESIRR